MLHQIENFLTQSLQDHISWIWTPDPIPSGPYFLDLDTLPETIDPATLSCIKSTISCLDLAILLGATDPNLQGPYFLDMATLPETADLLFNHLSDRQFPNP